MPHYNYGHYVTEAIESIFQEEGDVEVIVIDDASTDQSKEILVALATRFPSLRLFWHETNQGVHATAYEGLLKATGDFVHFFSPDDLYLPGALKTMLTLLHQHPDISLFCSDHATFSNAAVAYETKKLCPQNKFSFFPPSTVFHLFQTSDFWIPGHTLFCKKTLYIEQGKWDETLKSCHDWVINHRLALVHGIGYYPAPLIAFRVHAHSYNNSLSKSHKKQMWLSLISLIEAQKDSLTPFYKSGIMRMLGLKPILGTLLRNPCYWKYLWPMIKRQIRIFMR